MVVYSFELGSMAFSCNYFHKLFHHRIYICQEIRIQQVVSSHEHWALFLCSLIYRWLILQKVNYLEYRFYLYFLLALDLLISRRTCFCILTGLQMECFYLNFWLLEWFFLSYVVCVLGNDFDKKNWYFHKVHKV